MPPASLPPVLTVFGLHVVLARSVGAAMGGCAKLGALGALLRCGTACPLDREATRRFAGRALQRLRRARATAAMACSPPGQAAAVRAFALVLWGLGVSLAGGAHASCDGVVDPARATVSGAAATVPSAPVLLTVLSPRMAYALQEWPRMRQSALELGFRVVECRDPTVPLEEWRAAVAALGKPGWLPPPLLLRQPAQAAWLNHAPTSIVMGAQGPHPWPIQGVMPDAPWRALLMARLADRRTLAPPPGPEGAR